MPGGGVKKNREKSSVGEGGEDEGFGFCAG